MSQFMLLLHETPGDFQDVTPEQMQAIIERYRAWSEGLAQAGKMAGALAVIRGELHARIGEAARAAEAFRSALANDCPEPVRRRLEERLRSLTP